MPRPARLELDFPAPEKLTDTIGMRILDTSLLQKLIGLSNGGYLSLLHGLLELFKGFGRDQLLAATFVYPAFEQLFQTAPPVAGKPPLALAPTVAQSVGSLSQVRAFSRLQEP